MAKELNQILDKEVNKETGVLIKPTYIGKSEAFLEGVVAPIYQTIVKVACLAISWIFTLIFFLLFISHIEFLTLISE